MNYSEILDDMASKKPGQNILRLSSYLPGEPGKIYESRVICRIISQDLDGTTLEVLEFNHNGPTEKPISQVIPSPS